MQAKHNHKDRRPEQEKKKEAYDASLHTNNLTINFQREQTALVTTLEVDGATER